MKRNSKTIRVSFEVLEKLKTMKESDVDSADDVLRRILKIKLETKKAWDKF